MSNQRELQNSIDGASTSIKLSVVGGIAAGTMAIVVALVAANRGGDTLRLAILPFSLACLFAIGSLIYGILCKNKDLEEEEKILLSKRVKTNALDISEDVRFTASRTFENYQRFAPYVLAVLAFCITLGFLWNQWGNLSGRDFSSLQGKAIHSALIAAVMMLLSAFAGAFFIGQSRSTNCRWLRPLGAWYIVAFLTLGAASIGAICFNNNLVRPDRVIAGVYWVVFAVLGAEFVVNFVVEFYRPRTLREVRPVFESRLLALFIEPGGVLRNIAGALDYQFGFKVSSTWVYSFLERSFFPILLVWILLLWGFTTIHELGPDEVGLKEHFGVVIGKPLKSGIYWTLPYPFGEIRRFSTTKLHQLVIGEMQEIFDAEKSVNSEDKPSQIITWTKSHGGENDNFVVAVPEGKNSLASSNRTASISFVRVSIPVQYRIREDGVLDYAYRNSNPVEALKRAGESVATEYLASCSMQEVMSTKRREAEACIKKEIQRRVDELKLGIDIVSVAITGVHPPVGSENFEVAAAFQNIIGAMESKMTEILRAESYSVKQKPESIAEALEIKSRAAAYCYSAKTVAEAEAMRFSKQLATYRVLPAMFKLRTYLDFLESGCKDKRKFILSSELGDEVLQFNMEIKERLDLVDADITKLTYN